MVPYDYRPNEMRVMANTELGGWLKRRYGEDVVLVYHCKTKLWSISLWLNKWKRLEDLLAIASPGAFEKEDAERLDYLLNGPSSNPREKLIANQREYYRLMDSMREQETGLRRHLAKKTGVPDPLGM